MNKNTIHDAIDLVDWKFKLGEEQYAWYKGFDDSTWRTVNIPHDWAVRASLLNYPFEWNGIFASRHWLLQKNILSA